ncbi:Transcriptional regulator, LysR family [plant metagenome]|uniref:Transcriptional regulator, LysR family n=1 Tax=plant metagenome TaxID=1297885 RepID=A0A484SGL4_9ZZZZ
MRYFIAVAEELHFYRAAERLHIDQSPLSRAIKELESELGTQLLIRDTRGTRLTWAGQVFLEDARRIINSVEQAKRNAAAAATGFRGTLRVALSDGISPTRLATLLAQCREEEPEVDIRLSEVSLSEQLKGLRDDLFDVGFARSNEVGDGMLAAVAWEDPIVLATPPRHPLLKHKQIPLAEALDFPLVLCDPVVFEGCHRQMERILRTVDIEPIVADYVSTQGVMVALVSAGYGVGFTCDVMANHAGIVSRPIAGDAYRLTTYLLRQDGNISPQLERFVERACANDSAGT